MKNSTEEKEKVRKLLKRPFEILNERPADMSQTEYRELLRIQNRVIKLTGRGKFVAEVAPNQTRLMKSIGQYPSRHLSTYCKSYTKRKDTKYQKRFLSDLAGNLSEIPKHLVDVSNYAITQATGKDVVTRTFINN